jgi:hypothetical protein
MPCAALLFVYLPCEALAKIGYFQIEIGHQKQNQSKFYDTLEKV